MPITAVWAYISIGVEKQHEGKRGRDRRKRERNEFCLYRAYQQVGRLLQRLELLLITYIGGEKGSARKPRYK